MNQTDVAYARLIKMIERELELAGQGKVRALQEAVHSTGEYMASLPLPAPDSARAAIHRATALRGRLAIETQRLQERIGQQRASRRTARRLARTYAGVPPRPPRGYSTNA